MASPVGELLQYFISCPFQVSAFESVDRSPQLINHSPPQLILSILKMVPKNQVC